jgi:hypothetical protein
MRTYENAYLDLRTYRSPSEIRHDMKNIVDQLEEMEKKLDLRDLIVEAIYKNESQKPNQIIEELHILLDDAERAHGEIDRLREALSILGEELADARAVRL